MQFGSFEPDGMIWLYRLAYLPALLLAMPYYGWRMWRRGGYAKDVSHRWGKLGRLPPKRPGVKRIWLQSVSVGESLAIAPLLKVLKAQPEVEVFLTTTTSTGRALIEERYAEMTAWRGVFPSDCVLFSGRAWKQIEPDLVILMESELWPEHLRQAANRGVPVLLINARMSQRSARRYAKLKLFARPLLRPLSLILAAGEADAEHFRQLQLSCPIETTGNLKFDFNLEECALDAGERKRLRAEMGFLPDEHILLGASTWPGEEVALVRAAQQLRAQGLAVRVLLVPRHAERRGEIARELQTLGASLHFRSASKSPSAAPLCYVADTTGELRALIQVATVAFIGKSMAPHSEGQTPIEAAAYAKPILFGAGMSNFQALASELIDYGAATVVTPGTLAPVLSKLLTDPTACEKQGAAARQVFERHRGAVGRIHRHIEDRLHACRSDTGAP